MGKTLLEVDKISFFLSVYVLLRAFLCLHNMLLYIYTFSIRPEINANQGKMNTQELTNDKTKNTFEKSNYLIYPPRNTLD